MIVSFFDTVHDNQPKQFDGDFGEIVGLLRDGSQVSRHRADKEHTLSLVAAEFSPALRKSQNVVSRCAFTGDVDGDMPGDQGYDAMRAKLDQLGVAYCLHTTTKSTVGQNRFRVILPFATPLSAEEYEAVCSSIHQMLGEVFDTKTFDAARLSIFPQAWHGAPSDKPEWDDAQAHHAFDAQVNRPYLDAAVVMQTYPPIVKTKAEVIPVAEILAQMKPVTTDHDYFELIDLNRSPLVTEQIIETYRTAPEGGRFYKFMTSVAMRALHKNLPCDPQIVCALALNLNATSYGAKSRPNAMREAERAVAWAITHYTPRPKQRSNYATYLKLRKK